MGSNIDLRKYQDSATIEEVFSRMVSGKSGYKTVFERKKILPQCITCGCSGDEGQKFCAQCGGKMAFPLTNCPDCKKPVEENEHFCVNCGHNLKATQTS